MRASHHYPTIVAFFLRENDREDDVISVECAIGDSIPRKALIRKRCVCGSSLEYDGDQEVWLCNESRVTLSMLESNLEPLFPDDSAAIHPNKYRQALSQPDCEGVAVVDEHGLPHLFVNVPQKDLSLLIDPIPVFEFVIVARTPTAPIVELYYDIGTSFTESLGREIFLNVKEPEHREYLERLASGSEVRLHFVAAMGRAVVASKRIKPTFGASGALARALDLASQIPPEGYDFDTALKCRSLGREASSLAFFHESGLLPCSEYSERFSLGKDFTIWELGDHIKLCETCRRIFDRRS